MEEPYLVFPHSLLTTAKFLGAPDRCRLEPAVSEKLENRSCINGALKARRGGTLCSHYETS